jgi:hypothetical protein
LDLFTRLCFALPYKEEADSALAWQVQLSRNLLLLGGSAMNGVYQKLIDRTPAPLDPKQVKTIVGFSHSRMRYRLTGTLCSFPCQSEEVG